MKKDWTHDIGIRLLKILCVIVMTIPFEICWNHYDGVIIGTNS